MEIGDAAFDSADEKLSGFSTDPARDRLTSAEALLQPGRTGPAAETDDDADTSGKQISTDVYADLMRSVPLLSRDEEESLGKSIFDSRVAMCRALSKIPAASAVLNARLGEVERGERPRTDVFFAPFEKSPRVSGKVTLFGEPGSDAANGKPRQKTSAGLRAVWRESGKALRDRLEEWRRLRDGAGAKRAAARLASAFRGLGPGFVVLREALEKCQALDRQVGAIETERGIFQADLLAAERAESRPGQRSANGGLTRACKQLRAISTKAGTDLTTLRACCKSAAEAHAKYRRARARMVSANLRLAHYLAYRVAGNGVDAEDLVQEAMIGLMRAVDRFDYRLGYKFSTYAFHWVRQTTMLAIAEASRTVRVAPHMHDRIRRLRKVSGELEQRFGRIPTPAELIEASGLTEAQVGLAKDASRVATSFDAPLSGLEDSNLHALIEDPAQPDPSDIADDAQLSRRVAGLLDTLPPREAFILRLRYGIGVRAPHTLEDIGARLGITRERTRQLEALAMAKLRERLSQDSRPGDGAGTGAGSRKRGTT